LGYVKISGNEKSGKEKSAKIKSAKRKIRTRNTTFTDLYFFRILFSGFNFPDFLTIPKTALSEILY